MRYEYEVLQAGTVMELKDAVRHHEEEGWNPQGGIAVGPGGGMYPVLLYQAMIRWYNDAAQMATAIKIAEEEYLTELSGRTVETEITYPPTASIAELVAIGKARLEAEELSEMAE